ncbi:hypothetical protein F4809DRAFT_314317 [Biscogniauxia mediterranea]|nr:hypothetical protein F4809DRAFT_314317 [Biscogniauxia mediterranea]
MQRSLLPLLSNCFMSILLLLISRALHLFSPWDKHEQAKQKQKQKQNQQQQAAKQRTKRGMLQGSEGGPTTSLVRRRGGSGPITSSGSSEPAAPASNNASPPGISPGSPGNSRLGRTRALVQPLTLSCICVLCPLSISLPPPSKIPPPNLTLSHSCLTLNPPPPLWDPSPPSFFFVSPMGREEVMRGRNQRTEPNDTHPSLGLHKPLIGFLFFFFFIENRERNNNTSFVVCYFSHWSHCSPGCISPLLPFPPSPPPPNSPFSTPKFCILQRMPAIVSE